MKIDDCELLLFFKDQKPFVTLTMGFESTEELMTTLKEIESKVTELLKAKGEKKDEPKKDNE